MIHKGETVEKAIRNSGIPITQIAKKLGISRQQIYNLFEKDAVEWELLVKLGRIINYDFGIEHDVSNKADGLGTKISYEELAEQCEELKKEVVIWRDKYIKLLESHAILLSKDKTLG